MGYPAQCVFGQGGDGCKIIPFLDSAFFRGFWVAVFCIEITIMIPGGGYVTTNFIKDKGAMNTELNQIL